VGRREREGVVEREHERAGGLRLRQICMQGGTFKLTMSIWPD